MGLFSQKDLIRAIEKADRRIKREQKQKKIEINLKKKIDKINIW